MNVPNKINIRIINKNYTKNRIKYFKDIEK